MRGCEIGREIGPPNRTPRRRGGPVAVEGLKQRQYSIQPVEGASKCETFFSSDLPGDLAFENGGNFLLRFQWSPFPK